MTQPRPRIDSMVHLEIGKSVVVARRRLHLAISSPRFIPDARLRYEVGQREYGFEYAWLDWPDATFEGETYTEILDSCIYPAMAEVAKVVQGRDR